MTPRAEDYQRQQGKGTWRRLVCAYSRPLDIGSDSLASASHFDRGAKSNPVELSSVIESLNVHSEIGVSKASTTKSNQT